MNKNTGACTDSVKAGNSYLCNYEGYCELKIEIRDIVVCYLLENKLEADHEHNIARDKR